jgi:hypothetical protein
MKPAKEELAAINETWGQEQYGVGGAGNRTNYSPKLSEQQYVLFDEWACWPAGEGWPTMPAVFV